MRHYLLLLSLVSTFACAASQDELDCDNALTTLEINLCIGRDVAQAEVDLERYLDKALERSAPEPNVQDALIKSQQAWLAYRKAHCDAVYEQWAGGTIRGAMFGGCMLKLTKIRTHMIWEEYLTYMDSSPPILPEPEL